MESPQVNGYWGHPVSLHVSDPGCHTDKGGGVARFSDALYHDHIMYLTHHEDVVQLFSASPCRSSGKWQDGSDPHLFAAGAAQ